jgi:alpha-tubulin suppressor-like RCC1 family protein
MARALAALVTLIAALGCTQRIEVLSTPERLAPPVGDGGIIREPDNFDPLWPDAGDAAIASACGECPAGELCMGDACMPVANITALSMTYEHACQISAGRLFCWGDNASGQLGLDDREARSRRTRVGASSDWLAVATGDRHSCGLRAPGVLFCWGDNAFGQLGTGDTDARTVPARAAIDHVFLSLACGSNSCCALDAEGALYCWGDNLEGKAALDDAFSAPDVLRPTRGNGGPYATLAVGQGHACAIDREGALYCWGRNTTGELGVGEEPGQARAPLRVGEASDWVDIAASQHTSCAVRGDGSLWCWGLNAFHELSRPELDVEFHEPVQVGGDLDWAQVESGWFHTCGLKASGALFCWGRAIEGQLGQGGSVDPIEQPVMIEEPALYARLALGNFATCAVTQDEQLYCWGANEDGQLGTGDMERRAFPAAVP